MSAGGFLRAGILLGMAFVGLDDFLHQTVSYHILLGEIDKGDAGDLREDVPHFDQARDPVARQVHLRDVAGHHGLELNPSRVRNIFICSEVAFWASSRITNESLSVRPRMNASGAISISPRSIRRLARSRSIMS